jgi:hypothetical protein
VRLIVALLLLLGPAATVPSWATSEQTVVPIQTDTQQHVEVIGQDSSEHVDAVDPGRTQTVDAPEPPSAAAKAASTAGKVVLGVVGAAVGIGFMIASLLFF